MSRTLLSEAYPLARGWSELKDLPHQTLTNWTARMKKVGISSPLPITRVRYLPADDADSASAEPVAYEVIRKEISILHTVLQKPHSLICADSDGRLLSLSGLDPFMGLTDGGKIYIGMGFSLETSGINGISAAMELRKAAVVKGSEHSLAALHHWTSICMPIRQEERICNYMNLSIPCDEDYTWAYVLLHKLVMDIEQKLMIRPSINKEVVLLRLRQHGLTAREVEVAWRWLNNQSAFQIANELHVTEGTIRNYIKKIYSKTGVREKGRLINKFNH